MFVFTYAHTYAHSHTHVQTFFHICTITHTCTNILLHLSSTEQIFGLHTHTHTHTHTYICTCSQLQIGWHIILRLLLKLCQRTPILPMWGLRLVPGKNMVLILNPMRILAASSELKVLRNHLMILCHTICNWLYMYKYTYVYTYIYIYICMYMYTYIYIYR